jgi:hypothetical protein
MLFLRYYFWIAPHVLLGLILFVALRKRLLFQLPVFYVFVAFEILRFIVLFTINFLPRFSVVQYEWALVLGLGVSILLRIGTILEAANELLSAHVVLAPSFRVVLKCVSGFLVLVAVAASARLTVFGIERARYLFHTLDLSSSVLQVGLLVTAFLFTRAFHISWRRQTFGIVLGFGLFAAIELSTSALRPGLGASGSIIIDVIQMTGFHVCTLIWLVYLIVPERTVSDRQPLRTAELESWNQEVQRLVRR